MLKKSILYRFIIIFIVSIASVLLVYSWQNQEKSIENRVKLEDLNLEEINLDKFQTYIKSLYENGTIDYEISKVTNKAIEYVNRNLEKHKNEKLAVVFDLDETMLSNYDNFKKMLFAIDWNKLNYDSCTLIKPTYELYKHCLKNNLRVILITARQDTARVSTINNLNKYGIKNWDTLFLAPEGFIYSTENSIKYKTNSRKAMADLGYKILFSIGDKNSDLIGGFCDTTFKLINVLY